MAARKKAVKKKATKKKTTRKKTVSKKKKVTPIPEGYTAVTASLKQENAAATIAFCQAAFGAKVKVLIDGPDGKVMHSQLKIGDAVLHISDCQPGQRMVSSLMLYVKDVDKVLEKALAAGGRALMPIDNMFWGDRFVLVEDPQGNQWEISSRIEIITNAELKKRTKAFMQSMGT